MRIRRALDAEAPELSAIAYASKAHWRYSDTQLEAWRDELTVLPRTVSSLPTFVAEDDEGIAGFYVLTPSSPYWKLEHFWVLPSRMGRGVGRALLAHAAALASEGGAAAIAIDADPNAEAFYVACGARRVGSIGAPIEGSPCRERPQLLLATG